MPMLLPLAKRILKPFGYGLHRIRFDLQKEGYTPCPPYTYSTFAPWFTPWFQDIYGEVRGLTDVTEDRCYMLHSFAGHCLSLNGDFAECGVYKGGTALIIHDAIWFSKMLHNRKNLHLFDTFKGMPETNGDPSDHRKGDLGDVSLDEVEKRFEIYPQIVFHPGLIPETFKDVEDRMFAFIHIDVDLYQTTKDCCNFFYPRLVKGGMIIFDDYGFPRYELAQRKAVDEFFENRSEEPISLRTGQCLIIKM